MMDAIRILILLFIISAQSQTRICKNLNDRYLITNNGKIIYNNRKNDFWKLYNEGKCIDVKRIIKDDTLIFSRKYEVVPYKKGTEFKKVEEKYIFLFINNTNFHSNTEAVSLKPINDFSKQFFGNEELDFKNNYNLNIKVNDVKQISFSFYDILNDDHFSMKLSNKDNELFITKKYINNEKLVNQSDRRKLSKQTREVLLETLAQSGIKQINSNFKGNEASHCYTNYSLSVTFTDSSYEIEKYQVTPFYLRCLEKYLLSFFKFYED